MLGVVRGVFLALTVSLGLVSSGNSGSGSVPPTTTPETVLVASATTTTITIALPDLDPLAAAMRRAKWQKVAICETGGNWQMRGGRYSGGIGIRNDVWLEYGGGEFGADAGLATPEQQIIIGTRIWQRYGTPNHIPDQHGCAAW